VALGGVRTPAIEPLLQNADLVKRLVRAYPVGRLGEPADPAALITFLASDAASWITAQTYPVNADIPSVCNDQEHRMDSPSSRAGAPASSRSPWRLRCDDQTQTYEQLYERSCRLANALKELGVEPGERIATLSDNCPETVEQMAGIALGGYVRTALYTHNSGESNLYLLDLVEASVLIVEAKHYDAVAPHLADAASVRHVLVFGADTPPARATTSRRLPLRTSANPGSRLLADDPHVIRFSAGTTGKPKGILHTVAGWRGSRRD